MTGVKTSVASLINFRSCLGLFICVIALCLSAPSFAQSGAGSPPNARTYVDGNSVDLFTGERIFSFPLISIGHNDGTLSSSVTTIRRGNYNIDIHNYWGAVNDYPTRGTVVSIGGSAEDFDKSGSTFTAKTQSGSTLTLSGGIYTYTTADGTEAVFDTQITSDFPMEANEAVLTGMIAANGAKMYYDYDQQTVSGESHVYLRSVRNNFGYQLKYENEEAEITAINNRVEYCDPTVESCNAGSNWGMTTFERLPETATSSGTFESMDFSQQDMTYFQNGGQTVITSSEDDLGYSFDGSGRVTSVMVNGGNWSYSYSDSGGQRTTTITDPFNRSRTVISSIADKTVTSDTDALGREVSYTYDSYNRVKTITSPALVETEYTYDSRGNVTEVRRKSIGSALPDIVTTAGYPASCNVPKTCNKPLWTKDARGKQTDYTYHSSHGGIATVTGPAPATGLPRPRRIFNYANLAAQIKDANGNLQPSPDKIWRLNSTRYCPTATTCVNTAQETVSTQSYSSYNLAPAFRTTRSGNSSISLTTYTGYDEFGNLTIADGQMPSSIDRTYHIYEGAEQRLIGSISPDPDASGSLKRRAIRYNYDAEGQLTDTETGTATGTSLSALNNMTVLGKAVYQYDAYGRRTRVTAYDGAIIQAVSQTEYDLKGRVLCRTARMDKNNLTNLPGACAMSASYDRITKFEYNQTDQLTKTHKAYLTADQTTERIAYFSDGNVVYIKDGAGNRTDYRYDAFGRHYRTMFPHKTNIGIPDAQNDELTYFDDYGRIESRRLRDNQLIYFDYDDLGRITDVDAPGTVNDQSFIYDLQSRITSVTKNGTSITHSYDALGRVLTESTPFGTVAYGWDANGRNSQITYPGTGLHVNYDYDTFGRVTKIRENGATSGAGVLAEILYNDKGQRTHLMRGNGHDTTYSTTGLSASLDHDVTGTADDLNLSFEFNPAGQMTSKTRSNTTYDWDAGDVIDTSFAINGLNQAISWYDGSITYDTRGNLKTHSGKSFDYDIYNNLTAVSAAGISVTLDYDAKGRLSEENSTNGIVQFAYAGNRLIAEYDSNNALLRRYVHGPRVDEPLVVYEGAGTGTKHWMMADTRGSVIGYTDINGTVTDKNSYSPEGVPDANNVGRFGYTGQMWLAEAELYHYKARAYDPQLGRFLQTDPIGYGDGLNMYAYVGNDAVNNTDPSGLSRIRRPHTNCRGDGSASNPRTCESGGSGGGGWTSYSPTIYSWSLRIVGSIFGGGSGGGGGAGSGDEIIATGQRLAKDIKDCIKSFGSATKNAFVFQTEYSVGFAVGASFGPILARAGFTLDAFSVRFRFGTQSTGIFLTQEASVTGGALTEGGTAFAGRREMRFNPSGPGFFDQPTSTGVEKDPRIFGATGGVQAIQGVSGTLGIDIDKFKLPAGVCR